jgi:uncharacterized protein (DUF58 family)
VVATPPSEGRPVADDPLSPEFLRKLEYLRVVARHQHAGRFAALTRSRKLGSGIDFADHRPYTPGDDFKDIDWNLFGRLDRFMIRLAEEDTELNLYLLVDVSASMAFGDPTKSEFACRVAAALSYVGLAHLDRVHLFPFGDNLLPPLHPPRNKAHAINVYRYLSSQRGAGSSDLSRSVMGFAGVARTRGVVCVLSDFLMESGWREALDILRAARFEVAVVHLSTPDESAPDLRGELLLRDAETGRRVRVRVTPALLKRYRQAFLEHGKELSSYCRRYNLFYAHARTDTPFEELVLKTFRAGRLLG